MTKPHRRKMGCAQCARKFKDEHGLAQHMADVHSVGRRPMAQERYPLHFEDVEGEYEPRQFPVGVKEDDF